VNGTSKPGHRATIGFCPFLSRESN
jgi:hypothetical protein